MYLKGFSHLNRNRVIIRKSNLLRADRKTENKANVTSTIPSVRYSFVLGNLNSHPVWQQMRGRHRTETTTLNYSTLLFYWIIVRDNCIQHLRKGHTDHSQSKYHCQLGGDQALLAPSRCRPQTNSPCSPGPGLKSFTFLAKPVAEGWVQTATSLTKPHSSQHATPPQQSNSPACLWMQLQRQPSHIANHAFNSWTSSYRTNPVKHHQFL